MTNRHVAPAVHCRRGLIAASWGVPVVVSGCLLVFLPIRHGPHWPTAAALTAHLPDTIFAAVTGLLGLGLATIGAITRRTTTADDTEDHYWAVTGIPAVTVAAMVWAVIAVVCSDLFPPAPLLPPGYNH